MTQRQIRPETNPERDAFYGKIRTQGLAPLWDQYGRLLTPEPEVEALPYIWRYQELHGHLEEASRLISTEEAERRVLMLENPAHEGDCRITDTLFSGLQVILPGEIAPAHRHSPNALRLVLEGTGAYTSVNGEKSYMEYGDYITTPNWAWHDHGNEGTEMVVWQDILDLPLTKNIGAIFYEQYPDDTFPEGPPADDSRRRYGQGLVPVDHEPNGVSSPIFHYPFEKSKETMEALANSTDPDPYFGLKMEFIDPTTGQPTMSTISAFLQRLEKGFGTERYQSTESTVFTCLEGSGRLIAGEGDKEQVIEWSPRDIFVVPCWCPYRLEADETAYLFQGTDRVVQDRLGLFRERRGNR